jgi:hypothetical protein
MLGILQGRSQRETSECWEACGAKESEYTAAHQEPLGVWAMSSPALPHPIDRFVQAVNQGDTKAFLTFFPKNGVVIDSGRRFAGHDAVRGWSDRELIGAHGRMIVKKVEQKKNAVTVRADWKSNFYTGPARFEFVLDGDQVRELRIKGE